MNSLLRRPAGFVSSLCHMTVWAALTAAAFAACGGGSGVGAAGKTGEGRLTVGVTRIGRKALERQITMSSELVPFQAIDVYAKESGYVRDLFVDYGTRVKRGQLLAVLEIPELEEQLRRDAASVANAENRVSTAEHELGRQEAQYRVSKLQSDRLADVAKTKPGLVAQQEVDDAQGKTLALESAVDGAKSNLQAAESTLLEIRANEARDKVLYGYSKITAPFAGVVTERIANLGTLVQAGTSSSTQAMPLVRLSEDDRFRLVIPVPESYVKYIRIGDPVTVDVPALKRRLPGTIARFSVDVKEDTRTMHTEVDVMNPDRVLIPGLYAEATLTLDRSDAALAVPLQAVNHEGDATTVYLVNARNQIEDRKVRLGLETSTDAEVLSGLDEGALVVTSDRSGLRPGELVRPQAVDLLRYQDQGDPK